MKVTQEPEGLKAPAVRQGALVLGGLSVLSVVAAWAVLLPRPGALERGAPRPVASLGEPAHIESHPFALAPSPSVRAASARERLKRYGWVDRSAGVVHVPLERAIDLYLAGAGPAGGAGARGVLP